MLFNAQYGAFSPSMARRVANILEELCAMLVRRPKNSLAERHILLVAARCLCNTLCELITPDSAQYVRTLGALFIVGLSR